MARSRTYERKETKEEKRMRRAQNFARWSKTMKFGFYCLSHPLDGFWKLTHEHRARNSLDSVLMALDS